LQRSSRSPLLVAEALVQGELSHTAHLSLLSPETSSATDGGGSHSTGWHRSGHHVRWWRGRRDAIVGDVDAHLLVLSASDGALPVDGGAQDFLLDGCARVDGALSHAATHSGHALRDPTRGRSTTNANAPANCGHTSAHCLDADLLADGSVLLKKD
jgi:hypothetical protein